MGTWETNKNGCESNSSKAGLIARVSQDERPTTGNTGKSFSYERLVSRKTRESKNSFTKQFFSRGPLVATEVRNETQRSKRPEKDPQPRGFGTGYCIP
jgi:hypothetical protein